MQWCSVVTMPLTAGWCRLYEVYPVVEVQYQRRDEGYLALGTYFDGQNAAGVKFQETQPVVMRYEGQVLERSLWR
jgi:hypothetical protein